MKILFCGLGSIGKRHARLVLCDHPGHKVFALRSFKGQETNDLCIKELRSWQEVDSHSFDVAFITNPTGLHLETAIACAERGMSLFLEKPIDSKLDGLDRLVDIVATRKLTAYVAYPLRFHPVMLELRRALSGEEVLHSRHVCASYLPSWRPGQDHLKSYSSQAALGGGVVLDLSHDIDLIAFLFGEVCSIEGAKGRASSVTMDAEDWADMIVHHPFGVTNLHLNYFRRTPVRRFEVDTSRSYFEADLVGNSIRGDGEGGSWSRKFDLERDDLYAAQLKYFFEHLGDPRIDNSLAEAGALFRHIVAFRGKS